MVTVNNTPIHLSDLNDAFLAVDSAKLECDGHTLMLSHALMEAKIPHLRFLGKVTVKGCDFVLPPTYGCKSTASRWTTASGCGLTFSVAQIKPQGRPMAFSAAFITRSIIMNH